MTVRKRCLAWDWTNTRDRPGTIDQLLSLCPSPRPAAPNHSQLDRSASHQQPPHLFCSVHNWNTWCPPELQRRIPFEPMVRTPAQLEGGDWAAVEAAVAEVRATAASPDSSPPPPLVIHFYNEPERLHPPVDPVGAARAWRGRLLPLRAAAAAGAVQLVSPSVASDASGSAWLDAFMSSLNRAGGEWPDMLGAHWYGTDPVDLAPSSSPGAAAADAAIGYLSSLHERFGLPLHVTELASISRSPLAAANFTARVADWADGTDWVREYAFFGCMAGEADDGGFTSPAARLMDTEGRFTELMWRLARDHPMKSAPCVGGEERG